MKLFGKKVFLSCLCLGFCLSLAETATGRDINPEPLGGWHILQEDYDSDHYLDIISFEWDYYMIHDSTSGFYGIIGYLVSNPRDRLGEMVNVLPNGGNVAIVAQLRGEKPISQYINFGFEQFEASSFERLFHAVDERSGFYAEETPLWPEREGGQDAMRIRGRSDYYEWDLVVNERWGDRQNGEYRPATGRDIGRIPGEQWTVDVIWPSTEVRGTVRVLKTGEIIEIDGHGYRENSWGRYALTPDGWDFFVFSEDRQDLDSDGVDQAKGVSLVMQTYHKSKSLDFTDLSFYDGDKLQNLRFRAEDGEMGWYHRSWKWDSEPWQCVPEDLLLVLENEMYRVTVDVTMGLDHQRPILSNITAPVAVYFIQEMFPYFEGTIVSKRSGRVVREFDGFGGAELSFHKSARLWPATRFECNLWGWHHFSHPLP